MSGSATFSKSLAQRVSRTLESRCGEVRVLSAFAKVNLRLKVEGRRPDGYHLLSMLNCSTSLCDTLRVSLQSEKTFRVEIVPTGALPEGTGENLVTKAFRAFWREFGFEEPPCGFVCDIEKRIPVGGGLGGGSADAGAMFRFLEECFGDDISAVLGISSLEVSERIRNAALTCGADVPYAYVTGTCWVRGIGEDVRPIIDRPVWDGKVLLLVPSVPMPTARFYDEFRRSRPEIVAQVDTALRDFSEGKGGNVLSLVENDFEPVVCALLPEVREGLRITREVCGQGVALTGSGSVFFALIPPGEEGKVAELSLRLHPLGITSHITSLVHR
jgi:4-diphosphocytidyl-2-C-methyl-D-erythritol kinase